MNMINILSSLHTTGISSLGSMVYEHIQITGEQNVCIRSNLSHQQEMNDLIAKQEFIKQYIQAIFQNTSNVVE